jgi:BirA family biotin operon repressor/biotin-[acetyl-CoA-carboxylase] ligase
VSVPPTSEIQWKLRQLDEVDSTNRIAAAEVLDRWNSGQSAEGIAIVARRQSGGRGQHGRRWESPPGGLYLSAVLENVRLEVRHRTALLAGVAVVEALEKWLPLRIRWPNDVVTREGKKLAGILCEALSQGDKWAVIVGIGVNVQTRMEDLPADLRGAATSLDAEKAVISVESVAAAILGHLSACAHRPLREIVEKVQARDALRGKRIELDDGTQVQTGVAAGISESGALKVELPGGGRQIFERGSVRVLA